MVEHNERGAVGFILHLPLMKSLNELTEFMACPPVPLYIGGPMDQENLFFLHRRPDLIDGGMPVTDGLYYGGDFQQVITHLKMAASPKMIFVYSLVMQAGTQSNSKKK